MERASGTGVALARAWHQQSAQASLERWIEVCKKEGWGEIPADLPLLIAVFGASWYFTRYIFYRGKEAALLLDNTTVQELHLESFIQKFQQIKQFAEPERQLERLRLLKNEIMLQILVCNLAQRLDQEQTEQLLTHLAYASLTAILDIFELTSRTDSRLAVYGMGRMAGEEMTFGSDLDLIFVFDNNSPDNTYQLSRKVRMLMRHIAAAGSAGFLYEVDMRLRPHGTSGALLTPATAFLEYHQSACETWERQMMTRCKPVFDPHRLGRECLDKISPYIYGDYDREILRRDIIAIRRRVQDEKGDIRGKYEVKRGPGGIMDIDFLTHYLQLSHGGSHPELRTCSTRAALKLLARDGFMTETDSAKLLLAYDFLKRTESSIRLFDLKPVSAFPDQTAGHLPVAAALGYIGVEAGEFTREYKTVTAYVREQFINIVGDPSLSIQ